MRLGLSTPVVVQVPGVASAWEHHAGVDEIARIAETADELGYDYLTCAEHVAVPAAEAEVRGATYWDPLATLSFLAARTRRIRLATSVVVLGYHHPLAIAKRYGTLDALSGGRLVLGVGVGSLRAEFELLGADFDNRGPRADDTLKALRASMSTPRPEYAGKYADYGSWIVAPHARQPQVPLWVGGRSRRSLRRAVELADGWMPFGLRGNEITAWLDEFSPPDGFEVALSTKRPLDPAGDPDGVAHQLARLRDAGATVVTCGIAAESAEHYCDQLARLRDLAGEPG